MVDLTHIGELLVAKLLKNNGNIVENLIGKGVINYNIYPEIKLTYVNDKFRFDGMSRIDVGITCGKFCHPIELKLGTTSMANNKSGIGRFTQGFRLENQRICGSMISILANKSISRSPVKHSMFRANNFQLTKKWILIVRTKKNADALKKNTKVFSEKSFHCIVYSFQELFTSDEVNKIMKEQFSSKDFYNDWFS